MLISFRNKKAAVNSRKEEKDYSILFLNTLKYSQTFNNNFLLDGSSTIAIYSLKNLKKSPIS
jgi:hypothetical protein